jgi:hypothetical protein
VGEQPDSNTAANVGNTTKHFMMIWIWPSWHWKHYTQSPPAPALFSTSLFKAAKWQVAFSHCL